MTPLLTTSEAAEFLTESCDWPVSRRTLEGYRLKPGTGPTYVRRGPRTVLYEKKDLVNWVKASTERVTK